MDQDKPIHMTGKEYYEALQQARREALEEGARAMCPFCKHAFDVDFEENLGFVHYDALTGRTFTSCQAAPIRKLITADQGQGQATQAEPVEGDEGIASSQD